jgi:hypothetical protein
LAKQTLADWPANFRTRFLQGILVGKAQRLARERAAKNF